MIYHELENIARQNLQRTLLIERDRAWSAAELYRCAGRLAMRLRSFQGQTLATEAQCTANLLVHLAAVEAVGGVPLLLPASLDRHECAALAARLKAALVLDDENSSTMAAQPELSLATAPQRQPTDESGAPILFTSGTSGPPKAVTHTWVSLAAAVNRKPALQGRQWLLAYHPRTFAGLQVILQALLGAGALVVAERSPQRIAEQLQRHRVEMASATPTFWRWLLHSVKTPRLRETPLRQITVGGEIADGQLLQRLREVFPAARLTHIYASTEMGVCFSVSDGLPGFPASWLDRQEGPARLRISADGELLIQSSRRMLGYVENGEPSGEWFATGDVVDVVGDRVLFRGRKSDTIHVGGHKVAPHQVEAAIRRVPHVVDARVYRVASSFAGEMVAADVQLDQTGDEAFVRESIYRECRRHLPKHMIPATVSFSTEPLLACNGSGDKLRREP